MIDEIVNNKDFQKSDTEIETQECIEELKFPQEYEDGGIIKLDDLNEKVMYEPRVQTVFKRPRYNNLSIFISSQNYYKLLKKTVRANGKITRIFKPKNFLDVRKVYQDEASLDMTLHEYKCLISTCWDQK